MRDPGERERVIPARHRLQDEPAGKEVRAAAAVALGHGHAEVTVTAKARELLRGPPFLRVHARRKRVELPARVDVRTLERRLLLRIQIEGGGGGRAVRRRNFMGHATVPFGAFLRA